MSTNTYTNTHAAFRDYCIPVLAGAEHFAEAVWYLDGVQT